MLPHGCRIQLLEELCAHVEPGRRAQVLQQLAGGQADKETLDVANVLLSRPPEFQPGEGGCCCRVITAGGPPVQVLTGSACMLSLHAGQLIAAGSYGRVYAGELRGCSRSGPLVVDWRWVGWCADGLCLWLAACQLLADQPLLGMFYQQQQHCSQQDQLFSV
jgi:hypothetical protein